MSTEIAVRSEDLAAAMDYAKSLAPSDLLPVAYRGKPANVLLAVETGRALGIPPVQAINQVHIINGTPALSANLMRALVMRAGHTFRITGDENSATATIIRRDDPGFEHTATWDLARAKKADLLGNPKSNWGKHPAAMLKARATAEVCRNAAADVLMGFEYTEDEVMEAQPAIPVAAKRPGDSIRAAVGIAATDVVDADPEPPAEVRLISTAQNKKLHVLLGEQGYGNRTDGLNYIAAVLGEDVESTKDLTLDQASRVIDRLEAEQVPTVDEEPMLGDEQ